MGTMQGAVGCKANVELGTMQGEGGCKAGKRGYDAGWSRVLTPLFRWEIAGNAYVRIL